jgi:signal transduction histidine kinase
MPEFFRTQGEGLKAHAAAMIAVAVVTLVAALALGEAYARPEGELGETASYIGAFRTLPRHEMAALALTLGILAFAVTTAILLVRTRISAGRAQHAANREAASLRSDLERAHSLLLSEPQVLVVWTGTGDPEILGDTTIISAVPILRRVLAFGTWLSAEKARSLEAAVTALRETGEGFSMAVTTLTGRHIEAEGRALGGQAVLRLKELTGAKRAIADLAAEHQKTLADVEIVRSLLEALPSPIWARDASRRLTWVNPAYARAVEADNSHDAIARSLELLDRAARDELARAHQGGQVCAVRMPVIAAGERRVFDIIDLVSESGGAGICIDATEAEEMRAELARMIKAHRRTLDQLPTGVAIFGADHRLSFYNAAYAKLWNIEASFLDQNPSDSAILDRLRAARKLPEQADFRQWRAQLHEAYRALDPKEHWWHLPDGRTVRVITTPNPEGGITYLLDDVTERLELERRFDALIRVQGETLDNLGEAVIVFASDGKLRLYNPAFARMWRLSPSFLAERPHVEAISDWCQQSTNEADVWRRLRMTVTGLGTREQLSARLERNDGSVIDYATVPLPDGATLVAFQDVSDTVNVERALRERNEALEAADALKNDFVHHVSYELRTPLTNIIGFSHLLSDQASGPLNEKQREYLGYISSSSASLLAIINDVLDLASIDAGAMKLDVGPTDIRQAAEAAVESVRDRLAEKALRLDLMIAEGIGSFMADERRIRQVLYNLLSNAISFSVQGGIITLKAERRHEVVVLSVRDRGRGIPQEIQDRVFSRFETHALGSQHRGVGLGLSIVRSFVELHGGTVSLQSEEGVGTTVTCIFPLEDMGKRVAAE